MLSILLLVMDLYCFLFFCTHLYSFDVCKCSVFCCSLWTCIVFYFSVRICIPLMFANTDTLMNMNRCRLAMLLLLLSMLFKRITLTATWCFSWKHPSRSRYNISLSASASQIILLMGLHHIVKYLIGVFREWAWKSNDTGWLKNIWFALCFQDLTSHTAFKSGVLSLHLISHNFFMWWLDMKQIRKKYWCWSGVALSRVPDTEGLDISNPLILLSWTGHFPHLLATMSFLFGVKTWITSNWLYFSSVYIMCLLHLASIVIAWWSLTYQCVLVWLICLIQ
jgi:hypothetical protein